MAYYDICTVESSLSVRYYMHGTVIAFVCHIACTCRGMLAFASPVHVNQLSSVKGPPLCSPRMSPTPAAG